MLTELQAKIMLELQAAMNAKVNEAWVEASYPYLRAVVVEGSEAMEHHGWKWWKKQECDLEQLQMELVDIWHFILSHILLEFNGDEEQALNTLLTGRNAQETVEFDGRVYDFRNSDLITNLELTIGLAAARRISIPLFETLLKNSNMDWNDLFCQYVGKNVLNIFRQDNGYKEGSYKKHWCGKEDNEHLVEIMADLDSSKSDFKHLLYESLADRYQREA